MKKIFVTGGAGYIGSVCVESLLNAGFEVAVFDNLSEGHRLAIDPRATFFYGDLKDLSILIQALQTFEPEAVMHFAAHALVAESMQNPGKYFHNNICNGLHLLEAMQICQVRRFIFSSTCAIFGAPQSLPLTENHPLAPINPYGESKLLFEKMLRWYQEVYGWTCVSLRYFNAAGASEQFGEDHRIETHLIPNILKVALGQKEQVEIFGRDYPTADGSCVRDYIHVQDLAQAHLLALTASHSGCYNLGTGGGSSVLQILHACEKITGKSIPHVNQPRREGDPASLVASSDHMFQTFGWRPQIQNLETLIESAWKWHCKYPYGYEGIQGCSQVTG